MHPVLFSVPAPWGAQPIYAYGVMLGLSLIVGYQVVLALGKRDGLAPALLGDVYLTAAIAGVAGARLLYVLTNRGEVTSPAQWLDVRGGGLVAYGGFLGGFLGALVHLRVKRSSLLAFGDAAAPALGLGLFFTRIGCYLYGCDFGVRLPAAAPGWLARLGTFPRWDTAAHGLRGSPAFLHHVNVYELPRDAAAAFPVHPTQLYEAVFGLWLMAVSLRWRSRRAFTGQVLLGVTFLYAVGRFALEYVRDDPERGSAFGFSTSQLISLVLAPLAALTYSALRKKA